VSYTPEKKTVVAAASETASMQAEVEPSSDRGAINLRRPACIPSDLNLLSVVRFAVFAPLGVGGRSQPKPGGAH